MGITAKATDLSLTDLVEGRYVWTHLEEECPRTLVQLYRGPIKIFTNRNSSLEGSLARMEGKAKEQVAGVGDDVHVVLEFCPAHTRPEFPANQRIQGLHEKIRQICQNRREIAQVRLVAIAGADNPYNLLQVFGRRHVITKSRAMAYVTRCNLVEALPRMSSNCTEEIPVTWNNTSLNVDPISFVIKAAASPIRCNNIGPPRWKIAGRWYCAYPSIRECFHPLGTCR